MRQLVFPNLPGVIYVLVYARLPIYPTDPPPITPASNSSLTLTMADPELPTSILTSLLSRSPA